MNADTSRAADAIRRALDRVPGITREGLPVVDRMSEPTPFLREPGDDALREIETAIRYFEHMTSSLKRTRTFSSYTLKHRAEEWGERRRMEPYVSNGALIVATWFMGFRIVQATGNGGRPSLNANITVTVRQ
jgi:hypothetical protein